MTFLLGYASNVLLGMYTLTRCSQEASWAFSVDSTFGRVQARIYIFESIQLVHDIYRSSPAPTISESSESTSDRAAMTDFVPDFGEYFSKVALSDVDISIVEKPKKPSSDNNGDDEALSKHQNEGARIPGHSMVLAAFSNYCKTQVSLPVTSQSIHSTCIFKGLVTFNGYCMSVSQILSQALHPATVRQVAALVCMQFVLIVLAL